MESCVNSAIRNGTNSTASDQLAPTDYPGSDAVFITSSMIFFFLIMVIGAIGNVLLLKILLGEKKLKDNEYLILNLVLTDLSGCVISIPLDVTERILNRFPFGEILCKIVYPLQTVLMAVSVLTLLLMSYERYRLIVTPFKDVIRGKTWALLILCTWIGAFLFVLPYVLALRLEGPECKEYWSDRRSSHAFTLCSFVFLYTVPLIVITIFYSQVARSMYNDNHTLMLMKAKNRIVMDHDLLHKVKRNSRVVKVFVTAVIVFAVCLLPTHIVWLWHDFGSGEYNRHFSEIVTFCNILMYANCAIDPFVFGSMRILNIVKCCNKDSNTFSSFSLRTRENKTNPPVEYNSSHADALLGDERHVVTSI